MVIARRLAIAFILFAIALLGAVQWATVPAAAQFVAPPTVSLIDQAVVTLDASGNATWTYTTQFPATPAVVHLPKAVNTNDALICNWTAISKTSVSIHCWRTNVLGGLLSGLLGGSTAGLHVSLVARYIPPAQ